MPVDFGRVDHGRSLHSWGHDPVSRSEAAAGVARTTVVDRRSVDDRLPRRPARDFADGERPPDERPDARGWVESVDPVELDAAVSAAD